MIKINSVVAYVLGHHVVRSLQQEKPERLAVNGRSFQGRYKLQRDGWKRLPLHKATENLHFF